MPVSLSTTAFSSAAVWSLPFISACAPPSRTSSTAFFADSASSADAMISASFIGNANESATRLISPGSPMRAKRIGAFSEASWSASSVCASCAAATATVFSGRDETLVSNASKFFITMFSQLQLIFYEIIVGANCVRPPLPKPSISHGRTQFAPTYVGFHGAPRAPRPTNS